MIAHSIFLGVLIEGINFYGIGELSLFMLNNSSKIDISSAYSIAGVIFVLSLIFICRLRNHLKKYDTVKSHFFSIFLTNFLIFP